MGRSESGEIPEWGKSRECKAELERMGWGWEL